MSDQKPSDLQQVVAEFQQTLDSVLPLLKNHPMLQIRTETTIKRLMAGFTSMDATGNANDAEEEVLRPMKSFMGVAIGSKAEKTVAPVEKSEVDLLKEQAKKVYGTLLTRENSEILEAVPEIVLRSVAKLAGLGWVSSTKPAKLEAKFVDQIKEAIGKKSDLEKAKELERRGEILESTFKFTHDKDAKTWTLEDRTITAEQVLDTEFFDALVEELTPKA